MEKANEDFKKPSNTKESKEYHYQEVERLAELSQLEKKRVVGGFGHAGGPRPPRGKNSFPGPGG